LRKVLAASALFSPISRTLYILRTILAPYPGGSNSASSTKPAIRVRVRFRVRLGIHLPPPETSSLGGLLPTPLLSAGTNIIILPGQRLLHTGLGLVWKFRILLLPRQRLLWIRVFITPSHAVSTVERSREISVVRGVVASGSSDLK